MSGRGEDRIIRAIAVCDEAPVPPAWRDRGWPLVPIRTRGEARELNLRVDGLGAKVTGRLDARANDLVRIAAYCFATDQLLTRGGKGDPDRWRWRRELAVSIPVADPGFWSESTATDALVEALGFGTEDKWSFAFAAAGPEPGQQRLDIQYDERAGLTWPDSVAMLSGGTDSLCGLVEAVTEQQMKPVVVSHRTAPHVDAPQRTLATGLEARFKDVWAFPRMSFWIHLRNREAAERTRRTRGFLIAALGAAVAGQVGLPTVLVPDNGYVSVNPPVNAQLVGALNSRGTHPVFLRLVNQMLALVFPNGVRVENPLADRTRAEALRALAEHDCAHLLPETRTCAKSRRPAEQPHCGVCSQCVDRRFAALAAGLEDHDPAERYGHELFTQPLPAGEARTFAASYVGFAQRVGVRGIDDLFLNYPELELCLDPEDPGFAAAAGRLASLMHRHSDEVLAALGTMVRRHGDAVARRRLSATCLLAMAIGSEVQPARPPGGAEASPIAEVEARPTDTGAEDDGHVAASRSAVDMPRVGPPHRFERHSRSWFVVFEEEKALVDHSVGMTRLARLLKAPGQSLLALDLVAWSSPSKAASRHAGADDVHGDSNGLRTAGPGRLGSYIDPATPQRYEARAQQLREDREEAEAAGDEDAMARIDAEMETLTDQILSSTGKRGRLRPIPDEDEKARQTVSQTVGKALDAIGHALPALRAHLDDDLHLGVRCSYDPRPRRIWDVTL